jgi:hypothetical protein
VGEYKDRSNDPRITGAMKGFTRDDYHFALEVARQPASTAWEKKQQKRAATYARAYESRFQKDAFLVSGGNPLSAGGKGAYKDPEKVNMSTKDPFNRFMSEKNRVAIEKAAKKAGTKPGLVRGEYGGVKPMSAAAKAKAKAAGAASKKASDARIAAKKKTAKPTKPKK